MILCQLKGYVYTSFCLLLHESLNTFSLLAFYEQALRNLPPLKKIQKDSTDYTIP